MLYAKKERSTPKEITKSNINVFFRPNVELSAKKVKITLIILHMPAKKAKKTRTVLDGPDLN